MKSRNWVARFLLLSSLCAVAGIVACSKQETPAQPAPSTATSSTSLPPLPPRSRSRCANEFWYRYRQRTIWRRPELAL